VANSTPKDDAVGKFIASSYESVNLIAHRDECERVEFEKYMWEHFIVGTVEDKMALLARRPTHRSLYLSIQIQDAWTIWLARAALARGDRPEPPILLTCLK
jgi:hypothetical protein